MNFTDNALDVEHLLEFFPFFEKNLFEVAEGRVDQDFGCWDHEVQGQHLRDFAEEITWLSVCLE